MSKAHTVSLTLITSRWQQSALSTRPLFLSLWTGYLKKNNNKTKTYTTYACDS